MMDIDRAKLASILPWAFIAFFIFSAVFAQLTSDIGPWSEESPIESFTRGLLWMLSVLCLLLALSPQQGQRSLIFWLAGCVVLSLLAIDEAMSVHEWVERNWQINDDFPKIVLWILTLKILHIIYAKVGPYPMLKYIFAIGYAFHSLYISFEVSDGEFYDARAFSELTESFWDFHGIDFLIQGVGW
jgi:hypothetical protein